MYLKSYWLLIAATVLLSLQRVAAHHNEEENKENKEHKEEKMWETFYETYNGAAKKMNLEGYSECPRRIMNDFNYFKMTDCMDFRNFPQITYHIDLLKRHIKEAANRLSDPTKVNQKMIVDAGKQIMDDTVKVAQLFLQSSQMCLKQMPNKMGDYSKYIRNGCKTPNKEL